MSTISQSILLANPLATPDQRDLEDLTLRLLARPELQRAHEMATMLWRNAIAWPARDQEDRIAPMIAEYMFHYAFRAASSDANYPRVGRFMVPPHTWFGRDVPGSRWAGDSPDFIYRLLPIDPAARYEVSGKATCALPPTVVYQLLGTRSAPVPLGLMDSLDMTYEPDGSFVISIDPKPAAGRSNHIQSRQGADHVMIRDALGDWLAQSPNALTVRRLDPPTRAPLSDQEMAERAAQAAVDAIYYTYYTTRSGAGQAPNDIRPPQSSGAFGGMPTQWGCKASLVIEADEALIVTANAAGATFRNVVLCDLFLLSIEYWARTSSFNMDQMAADADGDFTYVVAHSDPGVHNWLDTGGLKRTLFGHRWQAIPREYSGDTPRLTTRLVKLDDLERALPAGVQRIDIATRRAQNAARTAGVARRFVDR